MDTVLDRASALIARLRNKPLVDQQREKPAIWAVAEEIWNGAAARNEPMNAEESARYDELTGFLTEVGTREQQERAHLERQRQLEQPQRNGNALPGAPGSNQVETEEYRRVFREWIRHGQGELEPEQRRILRTGWRAAGPEEQRALGTISGPAGGFLIGSSLQANVITTLKAYTPLDNLVDVVETEMGNDLDWPTNDDTGNTGSEVPEAVDVGSATDPTFGLKTLRAYLYSSKVFKVPFTLLQDAAVDVEAFIGNAAGVRVGRIWATRQAVGDGVNKIEGITVGGSVGKSFASATAVTYNELIDLEHSVDAAYRSPDRVRYLFADSTLQALRKLADSQNRPLWIPWLGSGVAGAVPSTFNGWKYSIANDMPSMATTNKSIAFGDFKSGYKFRRVSGMSLVRIEERYVELGLVGFLLFARADGRVVDTAAFKLGQQA